MIIGICGLAGLFLLFLCAMVFVAFWKHRQYMNDTKNKIKVVILPAARAAYNVIVDKGISNNVLAVPITRTNTLPRYFYNKENSWSTRYPENPFLGLSMLQVLIDTVYYNENGNYPLTTWI
jgi:hypothetical protein